MGRNGAPAPPQAGVRLSDSWISSLWVASEGPRSLEEDFPASELTFSPGVREGDRSRQQGLDDRQKPHISLYSLPVAADFSSHHGMHLTFVMGPAPDRIYCFSK